MPKRVVGGLTARSVATLSVPGLYADGNGLYLRVTAAGARSWVFRYQIRGQRHDMGLGSTGVFTLAEARERTIDARRLIARGEDPLESRVRKAEAAAIASARSMTFAECAERYIQAHQAGWRNPRHAAQWPSSLNSYVYPVFGAIPVEAIDVGLVMRVIEPLWATKTETASRVRGRVESILDWATTRGHRQGENPARWRGHLENLLPKKTQVHPVKHHAALPYPEIGAFMAELRIQEGVAARALEFAILTASRSGEVLGSRWEEFNLADRLWTVPAARMKSGREHRTPLSAAALAIVETMGATRQGDHVFAGPTAGAPLGRMALLDQLARMGRARDVTPHGFRSSFRDWCAERTSFPAEVAEMALAHTIGDRVEAAYRRGDLFQKRRQLMDAWARFCATPLVTGRVVPIRGALAHQ